MCGTLKTAIAGLTALVSVFGLNDIARAQSLDEILDCRATTEDLERLRCFDQTTKAAAESLGATTADRDKESEALPQLARDDAARNPEDSFGIEDLAREQEKKRQERQERPQMLHAKLTEWALTRAGKYVLILDNGQVWRQIRGDTEKLDLPDDPGDDVTIIIKKGLLGAHFLRTQASKRTIRVERVK